MPKLTLSIHRNGQYIKWIGYARNRAGIVKPKAFYLGRDAGAAIERAMMIKSQWAAIRAAGGTEWGVGLPAIEERPRTPQNANRDAPVALAAQPSGALSVEQAQALYIGELRQRLEAGQIRASHYRGQAGRLERALRWVKVERLSDVTADVLQGAILGIAALPTARPGYLQRANKRERRIGATYASNLLKTLKWFFSWADETERWSKPKRFNRLFKVRFDDEQKEPTVWTADELRAVWEAATERIRLWILLGLNGGLDRMGLATLKWEHISGGAIKRRRWKAGVWSEHRLWGLTLDYLERIGDKGNRYGLVCINGDGEPLVVEGVEGRADCIGTAWDRLLDRAGVTNEKPYGVLRKIGAGIIKGKWGLEISEMYLAHKEPGLNHHYAGRSWGRLGDALDDLGRTIALADNQ